MHIRFSTLKSTCTESHLPDDVVNGDVVNGDVVKGVALDGRVVVAIGTAWLTRL